MSMESGTVRKVTSGSDQRRIVQRELFQELVQEDGEATGISKAKESFAVQSLPGELLSKKEDTAQEFIREVYKTSLEKSSSLSLHQNIYQSQTHSQESQLTTSFHTEPTSHEDDQVDIATHL